MADNVLAQVPRRRVLVPTWVAKAIMATTGLIMMLFVLVHMIGNLKIFTDPEAMDAYAAWLRQILIPLLPYEGVLWIVRIVLSLTVILHVACALILWRRNRSTHTPGMRRRGRLMWTATLMMPTGIVIVTWLIVHLLDLTIGALVASSAFAHPDPAFHAVANVLASLSRPSMATAYLFALTALGIHLAHGIPVAIKDLGASSPTSATWARLIGLIIAVAIVAGDGAVVIYSLATGGAP